MYLGGIMIKMARLSYNQDLEFMLSTELKSIAKDSRSPLKKVVEDYWNIMADKKYEGRLAEDHAIRYLKKIYYLNDHEDLSLK